MNRLGMIIDVSQLSEKAMNDVLETSDAPVIISQGAVFAVNDQQTLNIKNDMLEKLVTSYTSTNFQLTQDPFVYPEKK